MRKIKISNEFLAETADTLKRGNIAKIRIDGESMYPFIRGGKDVVEIIPYSSHEDLPMWCCPLYKWEGRYMIHRYIGMKDGMYEMLGDGNVARIEKVKKEDVVGILKIIYHSDGTVQDCNDAAWLRKAILWNRIRFIRRWLIPLFKAFDYIRK